MIIMIEGKIVLRKIPIKIIAKYNNSLDGFYQRIVPKIMRTKGSIYPIHPQV